MAAWLVDSAIVWVVFPIVSNVLLSASSAGSDEDVAAGAFVALLLLACATPLYSAILHRYWHGQTLGKRALHIAVRRTDGGEIGLAQSLGRSYMRLLLYLCAVLPWVLDVLYPLWQADRRSLHDLAAGTVVVPTPRVPP